MSTIVECPYCHKEYLPGEATYCPRCGGRLPESDINIHEYKKNAKPKSPTWKINHYIKPRYRALELVANIQVAMGWFLLLFSFVAAFTMVDFFDAFLPEAERYTLSDGAPQLDRPYEQETNPTAWTFSFIIGFIGILGGLRIIASGQLLHLQIDLAEETAILNRETQRFFLWYAKRKRAEK